ncbi:uncharacterized protein LOC122019149 [Zingiber officinale]|uniref:uncharacterized protein LOC122019149 n=1 Tax=Zingiber officinale TaxID=94328 RepID=UPI001C4D96DC|nr:uncharacterized protein LOC122019149 [Zingiber officinale]
MDIIGPFPMATGQWKFLLVTVDYFSKWVEVEPLARIMKKMGNGQAEVANREILGVLCARLDHAGGSWVDELPSVLWALCTILKKKAGVTPFHLVYDGETSILVEVRVESDRVQHSDEGNAERRHMELDLVVEMHAKAVIQLTTYRQRMKQNYNRQVIPRSFQVGDLVWKRVKPVSNVTKLEAPWTRHFKVVQKLCSGAYFLEDEEGRQLKKPWSANHLQLYKVG